MQQTVSILVGAAAAAPLVVAFVGDRITGIKAFSVEVTLTEVSVPAESIEGDLSGAIMSTAETGGSASPELFQAVQQAARSGSQLLRINLRDEKYWWSTRVFLVAALAGDYTQVETLVFVRAGDERIFVGLATPDAVRARLGAAFPSLERSYRKVRSDVAAGGGGPEIEVGNIAGGAWAMQFANGEVNEKQIVGVDSLKFWLQGDLDTESLPYGPLNPLLCFRIVERPHRFAALTDERRHLVSIVDRDELALRRASAELTRRLDQV